MTDRPNPRPPLDPATLPDLVEVVEQTPSTNPLVTERARAGAPSGTAVVAEWQTAGRGRLDRAWAVPDRAALTFSTLLRPDLPSERWPWLPLFAGYAVHRALSTRVEGVGLKWPNDVLVGERQRKICGILVERVETPRGPAAVVGIGINVDQDGDELPVDTATSLRLEGATDLDRGGLLRDLHETLLAGQSLLEDADAMREAYVERCVTLGRRVRVELPGGEPLIGMASGIDFHGRLEVTDGDRIHQVGAGDVIHVRATDL